MWIINRIGFFSVVEKPEDSKTKTVTVRARVRRDLDALRAEYLPSLGPTGDHAGTDYPLRARVPKADFADALTPRFERDHDLAHVVVHEPRGFPNGVPAIWEATSAQDAYVRLHGRNAETWNLKGLASSGERLNYLYLAAELEAIAADVVRLSHTARRVHVFLNNNYGDYGVRNAADLARMVAC